MGFSSSPTKMVQFDDFFFQMETTNYIVWDDAVYFKGESLAFKHPYTVKKTRLTSHLVSGGIPSLPSHSNCYFAFFFMRFSRTQIPDQPNKT